MTAPTKIQFAVPDAGQVSALLLRPAKSHCLLVLAHGAGVGMRHSFLDSLAAALADAGVATLRAT